MSVAGFVRTPGVETWESIIAGTVWVWQLDPRTQGYTKIRVGGSGGSKTLRISVDDRKYNEEQVVTENAHLNPFRNGMLRFVRVDGADPDYVSDVDGTLSKTADELREYFDVRDMDAFSEAMTEINSELVLRRLKDLGEKDATLEQLHILQDLIEARFGTHNKSQKVVEQMEADGDDGSIRLS